MNDPYGRGPGQIRFLRIPTWQIVLLGVLVAAIGFALAIVATGIFLILAPIAVVAFFVARFLASRRSRVDQTGRPDVVDAEFEILDPPQRDQDRRR